MTCSSQPMISNYCFYLPFVKNDLANFWSRIPDFVFLLWCCVNCLSILAFNLWDNSNKHTICWSINNCNVFLMWLTGIMFFLLKFDLWLFRPQIKKTNCDYLCKKCIKVSTMCTSGSAPLCSITFSYFFPRAKYPGHFHPQLIFFKLFCFYYLPFCGKWTWLILK